MSKNNNKNFRVGSTRHYKLGRGSRSTHFFICLTQIFWGYHWPHQNNEMLTITEYGKYQEILTSQQIKEEEFFFLKHEDLFWKTFDEDDHIYFPSHYSLISAWLLYLIL